MTTIDRAALFGLFREEVHPSIETHLKRDDVNGLAVYENSQGRRFAMPAPHAQLPETDAQGRRLIGVYLKDRMRLALAYLQEHPESSVNAAAKRYGISRQALHDILRREKNKLMQDRRPVCPCCGQLMPKDQ
ncbi:hypothetical protein [Paraburkholderia youngii]|uniref:hypothetical protein n=1 Tax=Paraburkholderia youngii TaxID=2782701 RepID=UPI0015909A6E|nr:hypothetical protein [Paraburkholderia youngii]NUX58683.1 hypothetical protein [Paraburkholderia youngii]